MITARHLQQILAIAEYGTINRASVALNMSQPALTASISKLEERLRVSLFDRTSRGVAPTLFGQHIVDNAIDILSRLDRLESDIQLLSSGERGEIKIAAGPVLMHGALRNVIPAFANAFPNIKLRLQISYSKRIIEMVEAGQIDLGIATTGSESRLPNIVVSPLLQDRMIFVGRSGHPLATKKTVSKTEIWKYPLAIPEVPVEMQHWFQSLGGTEAVTPHISLITDDYDMLFRTVLEGDTLTAAPSHLVQPYLNESRLAVIVHSDRSLRWQAQIIHNRISELSPSFQVLRNMLNVWSQSVSTSETF